MTILNGTGANATKFILIGKFRYILPTFHRRVRQREIYIVKVRGNIKTNSFLDKIKLKNNYDVVAH